MFYGEWKKAGREKWLLRCSETGLLRKQSNDRTIKPLQQWHMPYFTVEFPFHAIPVWIMSVSTCGVVQCDDIFFDKQ